MVNYKTPTAKIVSISDKNENMSLWISLEIIFDAESRDPEFLKIFEIGDNVTVNQIRTSFTPVTQFENK